MKHESNYDSVLNRRTFIGAMGVLCAGLSGFPWNSNAQAPALIAAQTGGKPMVKPAKSTVYFRTGPNRFDIISDALLPLREQVAKDIGTRQIIVKVNCPLLTPEYTDFATHVDELRAILEFLKPLHDREILIAEGVARASSNVMPSYENYGYTKLQNDYRIRFIDANEQPTQTVFIHQFRQQPVPIEVNYSYMDPSVYLISAARLKTHDTVVGTFALKNVAMGAPQLRFWQQSDQNRSDKSKMHGGSGAPESNSGQELSYNLFTVALAGVRPNLSVVDGFEAIEGNGPVNGQVVKHQVAVVSTDFVAADRVCTELAGIDPFYMKYLEFCGNAGMGNFNPENITVSGPNYQEHIIKYKLHENVERQVAWIDRNFQR